MEKGNFITNYLRSSFEELSKVTWPTKNQAVKLTIIVLLFTVAFTAFLMATDLIFNELYNYVFLG